MSSSKKTGAADRSHGGPGSSRQNRNEPHDAAHKAAQRGAPPPGLPTNPPRSRVSGGGGERDIHHTHDPTPKS
jgi:hypothetical protein